MTNKFGPYTIFNDVHLSSSDVDVIIVQSFVNIMLGSTLRGVAVKASDFQMHNAIIM